MPSAVRITTGQTSFEGGVNSGISPTIASQSSPTGLKPNMLAWAANATVRGGGVQCRTGWTKQDVTFAAGIDTAFVTGKFQGAYFYRPAFDFPVLILVISGRVFRFDPSSLSVDELVPASGSLSTTARRVWFCQAEEFLVFQDGTSSPLVFDGGTLWNQTSIPVGTCMDYYMGRLWVANGREYVGGNIVFGPGGTAPYDLRDAVLYFTENTYINGGGSFIVPVDCGNITALAHTANMDTALGQGELIVFTPSAIFAMRVPPDRTDWIKLAEPLQRVIQLKYGTNSDRSVVPVNGDLFYRSPDGIRSLLMAIRYFQQWGNIPISRNENRIISREDRSLMRTASGILFDNRLLQTCFPVMDAQGTYFRGIMPLDFDIISSLQEREPPAWEGLLSGIDVLQLAAADFGGFDRAFAVALGDDGIELWELTTTERFDATDSRINWFIETPSFTWDRPFSLKQLDGLEIFADKLLGPVDFEVYFRPDNHPCWQYWASWCECATRTPCEDSEVDDCYVLNTYREQPRPAMILGQPPDTCDDVLMKPFRVGYQFQMMIRVMGWARIRGVVVHATPIEKAPYQDMKCACSGKLIRPML